MIGRHRGGRSLRRRLVVAVLAAAVGRGYAGRHRLADAALGRVPTRVSAEVVPAPTRASAPVALPTSDERMPVPAGRSSVAPWLRVVPTPPQPDQLADTLPHPVVTLFPVSAGGAEPAAHDAADADTAEEKVFALVDAERERTATAQLAAGADVRPYRARHTA